MARNIIANPGVIRIEFPIRARTKTAAPVLDVIRPNCQSKVLIYKQLYSKNLLKQNKFLFYLGEYLKFTDKNAENMMNATASLVF